MEFPSERFDYGTSTIAVYMTLKTAALSMLVHNFTSQFKILDRTWSDTQAYSYAANNIIQFSVSWANMSVIYWFKVSIMVHVFMLRCLVLLSFIIFWKYIYLHDNLLSFLLKSNIFRSQLPWTVLVLSLITSFYDNALSLLYTVTCRCGCPASFCWWHCVFITMTDMTWLACWLEVRAL